MGLVPRNANLPIGGLRDANRGIGVPRSESFEEDWFDDRGPHRVELRGRMQAVELEQVARQISVGVEPGCGHVDVLHAHLRSRVLLHRLGCRFHPRPLAPPQLGRIYGHDINPRVRQSAIDDLHEFSEIAADQYEFAGYAAGFARNDRPALNERARTRPAAAGNK